ncbi:MAG: hypothetical protein IK012_01660 [Fibrobacter sp.]|uniref:hypothetical protein n=1 Tax=Fibrobacter sp. TaxID=35828 RepID=UPI0025BA5718|nr:hypothetical protein [Fibrobacter sp.]MBR4783945.1 hypothetical protein [Fibrobacter sp.]
MASVLAQEAPVSVSQQPVSQDSVIPSVSQDTAATAPAAPKAVEPAPDSAALAVKLTEPDSVKVEKAPADSVKKGGLLDALFPVQPDEMISKGHAYAGATLSLIQANTEDDALNILIGDVYEAYGYTFTVEAFGGYFFRDAMAIGVRAGYSRTWFDIDFSILEDLMDVKEHRKYVSNGFFVQPLLKNYLKVLDSRLFYLFNETSIMVEYSYGISQTDNGEDMKKTRNRGWSIEAGINPGICVMVLNRIAFETSVGLLGLSSSIIDVEENGETKSRVVYNVVNFTINLLALKFSLVTFF